MFQPPISNIEAVTWKQDGEEDGMYDAATFGPHFHTILRKFFDGPATSLLYAVIDDACEDRGDDLVEDDRHVWGYIVSHAFTCFIESRKRVRLEDNTIERQHLTVWDAFLEGTKRHRQYTLSKHVHRIGNALHLVPAHERDEMDAIMKDTSFPDGFVENRDMLTPHHVKLVDPAEIIRWIENFSKGTDYSGGDNVYKLKRSDAKAVVGRIRGLEQLLAEAGAKFRFYEQNHRAKNTEDSLAKAEVNAEIATRIEAMLPG